MMIASVTNNKSNNKVKEKFFVLYGLDLFFCKTISTYIPS